jgi:hypothetical protein
MEKRMSEQLFFKVLLLVMLLELGWRPIAVIGQVVVMGRVG